MILVALMVFAHAGPCRALKVVVAGIGATECHVFVAVFESWEAPSCPLYGMYSSMFQRPEVLPCLMLLFRFVHSPMINILTLLL